jgi:hypothetical protein
MLVTFVLMGGFLYWLYVNAAPTPSAEIVEEEEAPEVELGPSATVVDPSALETGTAQFEGQMIELPSVNVASPVGSEAFFVDLPRTPFLVKLGPELVAEGAPVPAGLVTVRGTVRAMNDSIIDAWSAGGAITEGDRPIVEFATHFIEATQVETAAEGANPASGESGAGGGDGSADTGL